MLYASTGYFNSGGEVIVDCGDIQNMENLSLLIKNQWIVISPNEYLTPILVDYDGSGTEERGTGMCTLCVKQSYDTYWHIGTMGLMNYYAEFDLDNRQMNVTPLATGNKNEVQTGSRPDNILGTDFWTVLFLSLAIGLVITCIVLLYCAKNCDNNLFPRLNPNKPDKASKAAKKENVTAD